MPKSAAANELVIPSSKWDGFRRGYYSNAEKAPESAIASPSHDVIIDMNGKVCQRFGYQVEPTIALGGVSAAATCFYHEKYDVTFFAFDVSLKYYDWTTQTVYDTGVTLTAGTTTRFDSYTGDVYCTNTTDGVTQVVFSRLQSAGTSGDNSITVEKSMCARLTAFGLTSGSLLLNGDSYAYNSSTVSTGVIGLNSVTLSKNYPVGATVIRTHAVTAEKASKIFFWKERMGLIGSTSGSNSNEPGATEFFSKFASPDHIEYIIDFTFGAGGSDKEMIGKSGRISNALPVKNFLYTFKQSQRYECAAANVPTTGATIGQTLPDLSDEVHGCLNEDSACVIGNNEFTYIASDNRIIRQKIATDSGAAVGAPDDNFDFFIRDDLSNMDSDQTGARTFYWSGKQRSIYQIKIGGQWFWYIYDHGLPVYIPTAMGVNILYGGWYAPCQVFFATDFFERKGILYATDGSSNTVYSIGTATDDNGTPIFAEAYTGNFLVGSAEIQTASLQGEISEAAIVGINSTVTNNNGGRQDGSVKQVKGSSFAYDPTHGIGFDRIGAGGVETFTVPTREWEMNLDVYPSEANRVQLKMANNNGGYFSIASFSLQGVRYPSRSSSQ